MLASSLMRTRLQAYLQRAFACWSIGRGSTRAAADFASEPAFQRQPAGFVKRAQCWSWVGGVALLGLSPPTACALGAEEGPGMGGGEGIFSRVASFWRSVHDAGNGEPSASAAAEPTERTEPKLVGKGLEVRDVFNLLEKQRNDLAESLFGTAYPPVPTHSPVALLSALRRLHNAKYSEAVTAALASADRDPRAIGAKVQLLAEYLPHAEAAYCTSAPTEVDGCSVLFCQMESSPLGAPSFYIARNDDTGRFVIAIRGTQTVEDALTDLIADTTEFCNGIAHKGIANAAVALFDVVKTVLPAQMMGYPDYGLSIAGHSLGGGVTALLTKLILNDGSFGDDVVAVAIAPPPVFAPLEAVDEAWSRALSCFVNADDIVPRMSMLSLRNFLVQALFIDKAEALTDLGKADVGQLDFPLPNEGDPVSGIWESCVECKEHRGKIALWKLHVHEGDSSKFYPRLFIPAPKGVHWLLPHEPKTRAEKAHSDAQDDATTDASSVGDPSSDEARAESAIVTLHPSAFPTMFLTPTCVDSHMVVEYKASLSSLAGR